MSGSAAWPEFAALVAEVAGVDPAAVERETRIVAELGLDSLALVELVVALDHRYELSGLVAELERGDWLTLTAGEIFDRANRPATVR